MIIATSVPLDMNLILPLPSVWHVHSDTTLSDQEALVLAVVDLKPPCLLDQTQRLIVLTPLKSVQWPHSLPTQHTALPPDLESVIQPLSQ